MSRHAPPARTAASLLTLAMLTLLVMPGHSRAAGPADVSSYPVAISNTAKPNIMFILDDSGSMTWDFMPDDVQPNMNPNVQPRGTPDYYSRLQREQTYGAWSAQCNGVAFDPNQDYSPPIKADGTFYPNATYGGAVPVDGFANDATTGTATLGCSSFDTLNPPAYCKLSGAYYYQYTGAQPALSWMYNASGTVTTTTDFYKECMSTVPIGNAAGTLPGRMVFTQEPIDTATATIKQKYANWFSYYRTRQLTMRTAAGRAFQKMNSDSRIGFTVINDSTINATGNNSKFLNVSDYDSNQKASFFKLLYSSTANNSTPLRGALSKVGKYYAYAIPGQTYDPITDSCQRNSAILSTDGYWNNNGESSTYGPLTLANAEVGQQDGDAAIARPMNDGASNGLTGSKNSLADVAYYYWKTDLRLPGAAHSENIVVPLSSDAAEYQHLNTYTIGLGLKGTLNFTNDYLINPAASDFADLSSSTGTKTWPIPTGTTGGAENATHIDDLWHAAVNGHGQYFSVGNSGQLASALVSALDNISARTATGSAAGTSSQSPVQTDRFVFIADYTAKVWTGDLRAFQFGIDATGTLVSPDTSTNKELWSAAKVLNARNLASSPRKILFNSSGTLASFNYTNLTSAGLVSLFDNRCGVPTSRPSTELLTQCAQLATGTTDRRTLVTGTNLINYLSGDTTYYLNATNSANQLFRSRGSRLGDVVNAAPVYVGKPPFQYADAGYASFVTAQTNRAKMVYVAANDGMLHAFKVGADSNGVLDGTGGTEAWAFVPTAVMPDLWRLADDNYAGNHRYFVDASPVLADVYDGSAWHTILVGGLGAGGRSFYALDVTTPESPKLLWEFSNSTDPKLGDPNLGLAMGLPIVTKNAAGTWVVALTSGVNNVAPGDGRGRVYVLNAMTGVQTTGSPISTCTSTTTCIGDTTTPNNLVHLNAWTVSTTDNTALRYYGGDMLGNLWRFDADNLVPPPGIEASLLGTAVSPTGKVQPITTRPVLNEIKPNSQAIALVSFGTGRMMGLSDPADTTVQTIYTVKDKLDGINLGLLRPSPAGASTAGLVKQTLDATRQVAQVQTVNWADTAVNGWYVDLDVQAASGERVIINGVSVGGVLGFASFLPSSNVCLPSGTSYLYQFDLGSGGVLKAEYFNEAITGLSVVVETSGEKAVLATTSGGNVRTTSKMSPTSNITATLKRTSWRELVD